MPVIKPAVENPLCSHHQQVWECPDPWPGGWAAVQEILPLLLLLLLHRGSWNVNFSCFASEIIWHCFKYCKKWRGKERWEQYFHCWLFFHSNGFLNQWLFFGERVFKLSLVSSAAPLLHCLQKQHNWRSWCCEQKAEAVIIHSWALPVNLFSKKIH